MRRSSSTISDDEICELLSRAQEVTSLTNRNHHQPLKAALSAPAAAPRGHRRGSIAPPVQVPNEAVNFDRVDDVHADDKVEVEVDPRVDIVGLGSDISRYPWQRDVCVQCTIVSTSMIDSPPACYDDVTNGMTSYLRVRVRVRVRIKVS